MGQRHAGLREAAPSPGSPASLTLEALNVAVDHAGYFLSTVKTRWRIIREVTDPNVKMLFDIYHQQSPKGTHPEPDREHRAHRAHPCGGRSGPP